jgi:hypothetical protein
LNKIIDSQSVIIYFDEIMHKKIEKIYFNSPQLQLGVYKYYRLALAKKIEQIFQMQN